MAIEYNLGLVAGSLTGLRPLISRLGVLGSSKGNSSYNNNNKFSPSYRLENRDNKHWPSTQSSGVKNSNRFQGDSVLEPTVLGDRSSDESGRQHILKTQSISIVQEEAGSSSSLGNTNHLQPWQDFDRKL